MKCEPLGDGALRFALPEGIDHRSLLERLRLSPNVTDAVVTEGHAAVYFDPARPPDDLGAIVAGLAEAPPARVKAVHIRARYDGEDLSDVARTCRLDLDAVIALHSEREYVVRAVGFLPGFAYLGDLDVRLTVPRRTTPRPRVRAGSIGIAGARTGVYPFASPGGWSLIGTAVDFVAFDPVAGSALQIGDRVRFEPTT